MKLLMENKKKQAAYLAVILLCLGLSAWIWVPQILNKNKVDELLVASSFSLPGAAAGSSSILPYGDSFDTRILEDERFTELVEVSPLTISSSDLGRNNPFLTPVTGEIYTPTGTVATTTEQ